MKKIIFLLSMASVFFAACSDKEVQAPDDFTVSTESATFKLSDSVKFNLTGNPDNIVFYSGEPGNEYDKRDFFSSDEGKLTLQFNSATKVGATLPINLTVLISTDFNGIYDEENVRAATWTDITSRGELPSASASDKVVGPINLDDLKVKGKSMFLAFRYLSENAAGTAQRYWNIGRTTLVNKVPGNADFTIISTVEPGMFQNLDFQGSDNKWTFNTGTPAQHRMVHTANEINWAPDDDWLISRGFQVFQTHAGKAVNIKDITKKPITTFLQKYSAPGTYKATFIAMNANKDSQKEIVKEVWVTIEE